MAKMETMVPHILFWEVGQTEEEIKHRIWDSLSPRQIYDRIKGRGYHHLADDKGGPTMCGVTLTTFTDWRRSRGKPKPSVADLKALNYDEWLAILKSIFWDPCMADHIRNESVAMMLVDWRWVNGTQAVRDTQTVFSLVADGVVGTKTLTALNAPDARNVFERMRTARIKAYNKIVARSPSQKKWYNGWVNRTNSIKFKI